MWLCAAGGGVAQGVGDEARCRALPDFREDGTSEPFPHHRRPHYPPPDGHTSRDARYLRASDHSAGSPPARASPWERQHWITLARSREAMYTCEGGSGTRHVWRDTGREERGAVQHAGATPLRCRPGTVVKLRQRRCTRFAGPTPTEALVPVSTRAPGVPPCTPAGGRKGTPAPAQSPPAGTGPARALGRTAARPCAAATRAAAARAPCRAAAARPAVVQSQHSFVFSANAADHRSRIAKAVLARTRLSQASPNGGFCSPHLGQHWPPAGACRASSTAAAAVAAAAAALAAAAVVFLRLIGQVVGEVKLQKGVVQRALARGRQLAVVCCKGGRVCSGMSGEARQWRGLGASGGATRKSSGPQREATTRGRARRARRGAGRLRGRPTC